jgi:DNA-binding NarL/FixJ family response regulator
LLRFNLPRSPPKLSKVNNNLTPREQQIVKLFVALGDRQEVAERLKLSPRYIEWKVSVIKQKLNLESRIDLIQLFVNQIEISEPITVLLTKRENQILELIKKGYSYQAIAVKLGVKYKTVANHANSIISKSRMKNRYRLSTFAIKYPNKFQEK